MVHSHPNAPPPPRQERRTVNQIHPDSITVSVKVAAEMLGLSPYQIKKRCDAGRIESHFDGPRRLVLVDSLRAYVKNLPTERPSGDAA